MGAAPSFVFSQLRDLLRDLANEGKLDKIILAPSTSVARRMRTPLMAAADTGDLPLFNTVAHANVVLKGGKRGPQRAAESAFVARKDAGRRERGRCRGGIC